MKKGIYLLGFVAMGAFAVSCSSGWSQKDKDTFLDECKKHESMDCDCALEKVIEKYPKIADWNEKGGKDKELAKEIAEGCIK